MTAGAAPAAPATRARHAPVLVVLPALNEAESIARVVDEVRHHQPGADLLVVDDGSTDRTAEIARNAGARVMSLPFNLGVGGAMRAAYRFAFEEGYDCVVQVDADGQHDPSDIARLRGGARARRRRGRRPVRGRRGVRRAGAAPVGDAPARGDAVAPGRVRR